MLKVINSKHGDSLRSDRDWLQISKKMDQKACCKLPDAGNNRQKIPRECEWGIHSILY